MRVIQRYCPNCRGAFGGQMLCPHCGVQLEALEGPAATPSDLATRIRQQLPQTHPMFVRKLLIGLAVAQGLYYGLREMALAYLYAFDDPISQWGTTHGVLAAQAIQLGSLFIGALVAGAAYPKVLLLGSGLGLINVGLVLAADFFAGRLPHGAELYVVPPSHLAVALLGVVAGRLLWKPVGELPFLPGESSAVAPPGPELPVESPPLHWGPILLGAVLAFTGTVWAEQVRDFLAEAGSGYTNSLQGHFITWQVSTLALLLGGGFAGSLTRSGLRHGIVVGGIAALAVVGAQFYLQISHFPAHEFWLDQFGVKLERGVIQPAGVAVGAVCVSLTAAVGGALGGQLFPPTARRIVLRHVG